MADQKKEENPFADFESEEYVGGEPVEAKVEEPDEPDDSDESDEPDDSDESDEPGEPDDSDEPDESGEEGAAPKPKKSRKKTVQERINEVTRARREAERRAETAEAQLAELERRRAAAEQQREAPTAEAPKEQPKDSDAPKPDDYEYGELDARYIQAVAEHSAEKKFEALRREDAKAREARELETRQQAAREKFEEMIAAGGKKHEDFYEKVVVGSEMGNWPLSQDLGNLILESDVGNDVAYHLATHPEEAARVHRASPLEQARYFGKLEAKFSAAQDAAPGGSAGKPARAPKAPPPVTTARGADGRFSPSADSDDFAAFEARVNQE